MDLYVRPDSRKGQLCRACLDSRVALCHPSLYFHHVSFAPRLGQPCCFDPPVQRHGEEGERDPCVLLALTLPRLQQMHVMGDRSDPMSRHGKHPHHILLQRHDILHINERSRSHSDQIRSHHISSSHTRLKCSDRNAEASMDMVNLLGTPGGVPGQSSWISCLCISPSFGRWHQLTTHAQAQEDVKELVGASESGPGAGSQPQIGSWQGWGGETALWHEAPQTARQRPTAA